MSARPLTQVAALRKGSGNASTQSGDIAPVEAEERDRELSAGGIARARTHKLARVNQTRESALPPKATSHCTAAKCR